MSILPSVEVIIYGFYQWFVNGADDNTNFRLVQVFLCASTAEGGKTGIGSKRQQKEENA